MPRAIVKVREVEHGGRHVAWCYESGCAFVYANVVKSDVEQQASWHRRKHRDGSLPRG